MRVVTCIPGLHLEVLTLHLNGHRLQLLLFLDSGRAIGIDEVVEQTVDTFHIACHTVFQHIVGIGLEAQQLGNLPTQVDETLTDLEVVLRIVMDSLRVVRHIHLTAQLTLGAIGHKRRVRGGVEGEHPTILLSLPGLQGSGIDGRLWQSVQLFLIGDME